MKSFTISMQRHIKVTPYNQLHIPSFLLGCCATILISSLQSLFSSLLGDVVIGILRLTKYAVMMEGIVLIIKILMADEQDRAKKSSSANSHTNPKHNN